MMAFIFAPALPLKSPFRSSVSTSSRRQTPHSFSFATPQLCLQACFSPPSHYPSSSPAFSSNLLPVSHRVSTPAIQTTFNSSGSPNPLSTPPAEKYSILKTVMPSDTDYSFAMWHGNYLRWIEEARVRYLTHRNLDYNKLVNDYRVELPVRDVSLKYFHPALLGDDITVTVRLKQPVNKVRIVIESDFVRVADSKLIATAKVTIVPVDIDTRKIRRTWPDPLTYALLG